MTVAFGTAAPLGSETAPVNFPATFCAGRRTAASGTSKLKARSSIATRVRRDKLLRLIEEFSIAENLLSRLDLRAKARAEDQARAEGLRLFARSRSWFAYCEGSMPEFKTESSQAHS